MQIIWVHVFINVIWVHVYIHPGLLSILQRFDLIVEIVNVIMELAYFIHVLNNSLLFGRGPDRTGVAKPAGQTSCASEREETGLLLQITTMQSMARAIKKVISATQIIWVIHSALAHILLMCEAPPGVCVKTSGWNVVPFPPHRHPAPP